MIDVLAPFEEKHPPSQLVEIAREYARHRSASPTGELLDPDPDNEAVGLLL
jgi:hypothetical protein